LAKTSQTPFIQSALEKINKVWALRATIGAIIPFLASKIGEFIKNAAESPKIRVQIAGFVAKVAIYFAGLIVPLLLWIIYLNLTLWGLGGNWYLFSALYCAAAFVFFVLTLFMRPNANSLNPLYRDRLGDAFIFKPHAHPDRFRHILRHMSRR